MRGATALLDFVAGPAELIDFQIRQVDVVVHN
jgi:hypothetical protein